MIESCYRLEVGKKCVVLDDIKQRIVLESNQYTPMTFEKARQVANEIGIEIIKVYEIQKCYEESEKLLSINIFE